MTSHPLTNLEIQKYYQNEPIFKYVYSRSNFAKAKDGAYITNFYQHKLIGTHWIALYVNSNNVANFDSFRVEYIPKKIRKFLGNKNIKTNIYRIQVNDPTLCGYFYIRFIDFMLKGNEYKIRKE